MEVCMPKRLALERELGRDALECKGLIDLIDRVGLKKSVSNLEECYERLVKEFIVDISKDCDSLMSKEFRKVFVRGKCVEFSPDVINKYFERSEKACAEIEVTDNQICKEITAKQANQWPVKGKLPSSKLSVKYAPLHMIGDANWVPTNHTYTVTARFSLDLFLIVYICACM
jgi:hypothetical protein